ncbi:hypothetical protein AJ80_04806 [Polytolypa hystricis UAMH7299]|uniref:Copper transport protein n=1 Tax=Polytolypa hystricis (strain UAMH7299) TaxID=1447883 RepID=A0A2B7Y7G5_POLH7|nr:hypothetical protein AJ80_04806 [Polytolypa hystricis UAMH7299]
MDHDMASHSMPMATSTSMATHIMSMTTSGGAMDHGGMGDGCQISMLWNWNTINACFISSSWKITSKGMFAGSCIGVILLVMSLEFLRRFSHEYDMYLQGRSRFFPRQIADSTATAALINPKTNNDTDEAEAEAARKPNCPPVLPRPTILQHVLRSLLHMLQFGVAYFVMLLAMYYNGYFIICILIGAFLGSFVFSWGALDKKKYCPISISLLMRVLRLSAVDDTRELATA